MQQDFVELGYSSSDFDFIEFGMGYSMDGDETYAWTTYSEDDWATYDGSDMDPEWHADEWCDGTLYDSTTDETMYDPTTLA